MRRVIYQRLAVANPCYPQLCRSYALPCPCVSLPCHRDDTQRHALAAPCLTVPYSATARLRLALLCLAHAPGGFASLCLNLATLVYASATQLSAVPMHRFAFAWLLNALGLPRLATLCRSSSYHCPSMPQHCQSTPCETMPTLCFAEPLPCTSELFCAPAHRCPAIQCPRHVMQVTAVPMPQPLTSSPVIMSYSFALSSRTVCLRSTSSCATVCARACLSSSWFIWRAL